MDISKPLCTREMVPPEGSQSRFLVVVAVVGGGHRPLAGAQCQPGSEESLGTGCAHAVCGSGGAAPLVGQATLSRLSSKPLRYP